MSRVAAVWRRAATPLLLAAVTAALGLPALRVFFSIDDHLFLERAAGLVPWDAGMRRLVSVRIFFDAAWRLFGDRAVWYHLVVLTIHALNGWLVTRVARRLSLGERAAAAAGLAFVAAPAAFTVLHWISCIQEALLAGGALITTLLVLNGRVVAAAAAFAVTLLCKESAALLLPVLAVTMPLPRRRRILLGAAGIVIAILVLAASGAFESRPPSHPYATSFGLNLVTNLLTYLAWLARPWEWFPDRVSVPDPRLWAWGLVPIAALTLAAWRRRRWRGALLRGGLVFLALLAPVLPLVRHSYFYYLYLPLVPFWILTAAALDGAPGRRGRAVWLLPAVLVLLSGWQGDQRRAGLLEKGVLADPVLRYAELAEAMVADLRTAGAAGDLLVVGPPASGAVDLVGDPAVTGKEQREVFLLAGRALDDGRSVPVFLPGVTAAEFVVEIGENTAWRDRSLYLTRGAGNLHYLGDGAAGRKKLAAFFYRTQDYPRARREALALLSLSPDDPYLIGDLGAIALYLGRDAEVDSVMARLDDLVSREVARGAASASRDDLARRIEERRGGSPGTR